jgi:uncharacterized membrane protein YgcG
VDARTHSPSRWLPIALACTAGLIGLLAFGASAAQAALSVVDHDCEPDPTFENCDTAHLGDGNDNVMVVEPAATAGKVKFTEASPEGMIVTFDGGAPFEECEETSGNTAECPLAKGTGVSQVRGSSGNDTVDLKPGATGLGSVLGQGGNDTLNLQDGNVQSQIDCGDGADVANLDSNDAAPVGCETVNRTGGGGGSGGGGSGGGGTGGGGGGGSATPADTTGPAVVVAGSNKTRTATRSGVFGFGLGPFSEDVTGVVAIKSSAPVNATQRRRRKVVVNLGSKAFQARAGQRVTVRFKLSRKNRRLLARRKRIRMTARVTARDKLGNAATRSYRFTLKAPKRKRAR